MKTEKISKRNTMFQKFETLKINRNKRHKYNEFFVEGVRNINEAIKNNWDIISFVYSYEKPLSDWAKKIIKTVETNTNYELSKELMEDISSKEDTSELVAIVKMKKDYSDNLNLSSNPVIALFDRPSKKANLGTILRSCDSFGIELLIITGHSVDIYDPEVISSTMGSFFKVPFIKLDENIEIDKFLSNIKNKYSKLKIIGTTSHSKENLYEIDMKDPILFLIGNETEGLNNHLVERSDIMATIPMDKNSSASSLNVACASSIMFYEASKQRKNFNK